MRKNLIFIVSILAAFLTTACSHEEVPDEPQFLEVNLSATPEKAKVNEEIMFEAKVTYGQEKVKDADEVKFEIWKAHSDEHEKIIVNPSDNGSYQLKKAFSEEGTYYIISHVTARGMHSMPKEEFIVGSPSEPEEESDMNMEMDDDSSHDGSSDNHTGN